MTDWLPRGSWRVLAWILAPLVLKQPIFCADDRQKDCFFFFPEEEGQPHAINDLTRPNQQAP